MGEISGHTAFKLCFIAETAIFSSRTVLMSFRSDHRHSSGVIEFTPISVSFSVSHSMRSRCLVGATPMAIRLGQNGGRLSRPTISTRACLEWASSNRHVNRLPFPSTTSIMSPGTFLNTLTQCWESLSGKVNVDSMSGAKNCITCLYYRNFSL